MLSEVQALEELDAMSKLNADRRKLAFGSAQADIDEKYRVMSEELQKAREEMEVRFPKSGSGSTAYTMIE